MRFGGISMTYLWGNEEHGGSSRVSGKWGIGWAVLTLLVFLSISVQAEENSTGDCAAQISAGGYKALRAEMKQAAKEYSKKQRWWKRTYYFATAAKWRKSRKVAKLPNIDKLPKDIRRKMVETELEDEWQTLKISPLRALQITAYFGLVLGVPMAVGFVSTELLLLPEYISHGASIGSGFFSAYIFNPFGESFLSRLSAIGRNLGFRIWQRPGQDNTLIDTKAEFDSWKLEANLWASRFLVDIQDSIRLARKDLEGGNYKSAVKRVGDAVMTFYEKFRGVEKEDVTVLRRIQTELIDGSDGFVLPENFKDDVMKYVTNYYTYHPHRLKRISRDGAAKRHQFFEEVLSLWLEPFTLDDILPEHLREVEIVEPVEAGEEEAA